MGNPKYQQDGDPRTSGEGFALTLHPDALLIPYRWARPRTIFVNSMSDLFHAKVPDSFIRQVFEVMTDTPRHTYQILTKRPRRLTRLADRLPWSPNIWVGVSVETEAQTWRLDDLRKVPSAVRFVSAEPLLGDLAEIDLTGIDWLIAGGESGPNHRPIDPAWVRSLRDRCLKERVPFFFKQWGGRTPKHGGRELDGKIYSDLPEPESSRLVLSSS